MRRRRWYALAATVVVGSSLVVAGFATAGRSSEAQALTKVTLQSKWVVQSQFAGYYAAKAKGYYKQVGLDVNIKAGGPDILPEQVVLGEQAEFGINWFPSTLQQRDTGNDLVNIARSTRAAARRRSRSSRAASTPSRRCAARSSACGSSGTNSSSAPRWSRTGWTRTRTCSSSSRTSTCSRS